MKFNPKAIFVIIILLLPIFSFAHDIQSLDYTVYLTPEGHGEVTLFWTSVQSSDGTENYIPITNLGDSKITDFRVSEKGVPYTENLNWDSDRSREEKANTYGIANISDGVELIWGMGAEGPHQYEIKYTITNLVKNYSDSQALFWQFMNHDLSDAPNRVYLRLYADEPIVDETANVWAFGYPGTVNFVNGEVIAASNDTLQTKDYLTLLLEFPQKPFLTAGRASGTFQNTKERAFEGSDYETMDEGQVYESKGSNVPWALIAIPVGIGVFSTVFGLKKSLENYDVVSRRSYKRKYEGEIETVDPLSDDFQDTFYALNRMRITGMNELIAAMMLKWIREEKLEEVSYEEKGDGGKMTLRIPEHVTIPEGPEGEYFTFLVRAAGDDRILSEKKLNKYLRKHGEDVVTWERRYYVDARERALEYGLYEQEKNKKPTITPLGQEFEEKVHKYYNYLYDFSQYNQGKLFEDSWDDVMITAMLLNVGDRLTTEFERNDPAYSHRSSYNTYYPRYFHNYAKSNVRNYNYSTSSSGSGGSSSGGGGGGGSFGGGGGGGSR